MAFAAVSPIDGSQLGKYQETGSEAISAMLASGRSAATVWAATSVRERIKRLAPLTGLILADLDRIAQVIVNTSGKVKTEALLSEIFPVLAQAQYYNKQAGTILKQRTVSTSPFSFPDATGVIDRQPYGVVALISPWNYPFQLTLTPLLTALYAGNAVIIKASEYSLPVAERIMGLIRHLDLPENLVQWVIGAGDAGEQLIKARPDMVFFTGSAKTGRRVMELASSHPIPVLLELGGNDAMIVFADAHLERAANAALYGAFCNSGQACVAVKRLYVEQGCFTGFLEKLQAGLQSLKIGRDIGAIINEQQINQVQAHFDDAIAKGATPSNNLIRTGNYLQPVLLWNVTSDMRVVREETFGPLLPVLAFNKEEDAVNFANDTEYGLNCSIWSRDIEKAERVARKLRTGNWAVNDVMKNVGHPALPFGGVKQSGFGRYRGAEGLLSFSYPVSGLTNRNKIATEPNWFPYTDSRYDDFKAYMDFVFGAGHFIERAKRNRTALESFKAYSGLHITQHWHNLKSFLSRQ